MALLHLCAHRRRKANLPHGAHGLPSLVSVSLLAGPRVQVHPQLGFLITETYSGFQRRQHTETVEPGDCRSSVPPGPH